MVHERARHLLLRAGGAVLWDLPQEALIALEQLAAGAEASEAAAAMKISEHTFESLMDDLVRHLKPPKIAGLRMSALTLRFSRSRHPHANGIETAASRRDGGGS